MSARLPGWQRCGGSHVGILQLSHSTSLSEYTEVTVEGAFLRTVLLFSLHLKTEELCGGVNCIINLHVIILFHFLYRLRPGIHAAKEARL